MARTPERDRAPTARVAVLFNPKTAPDGGAFFLGPFNSLAPAFAVEPIVAGVNDASAIESVFCIDRPRARRRPDRDAGRFHHGSPQTDHRTGDQAPVTGDLPMSLWVIDGGLMANRVDTVDLMHRAAPYVDRILKGENPADLPVQAPTKFTLIINLKTAKALDLAVPSSLLARADEAIE
jgi:ABC transporter substrate binding protein